METEGADEGALAPISFLAKDAEQGRRAAEGTETVRAFQRVRGSAGGEELGVGFQENAEDEFGQGFGSWLLLMLRRVGMPSDPGGAPVVVEESDPSGWTLEGKLAGGVGNRLRSDALEEREKIGEVLQEYGEIELRAEVGARLAGIHRSVMGVLWKLSVDALLKGGEMLVKGEDLRGKGMFRSKVLRATNPRVVIGGAGLFWRHLRGVEEPTISLYHPGW